jgi:hypothetical protein
MAVRQHPDTANKRCKPARGRVKPPFPGANDGVVKIAPRQLVDSYAPYRQAGERALAAEILGGSSTLSVSFSTD